VLADLGAQSLQEIEAADENGSRLESGSSFSRAASLFLQAATSALVHNLYQFELSQIP